MVCVSPRKHKDPVTTKSVSDLEYPQSSSPWWSTREARVWKSTTVRGEGRVCLVTYERWNYHVRSDLDLNSTPLSSVGVMCNRGQPGSLSVNSVLVRTPREPCSVLPPCPTTTVPRDWTRTPQILQGQNFTKLSVTLTRYLLFLHVHLSAR